MSRTLFFLFLFAGAGLCFAQSPSRLTTDLLEHTDRIFLDGYPTGLSLAERETVVERYQPTEIRTPKPYLGWVVNSDRPNTLQTAYRIRVASSPELLTGEEADLWDSGRTESDQSVAVPYAGKPLQPSTVYYWTVKTWDNHGVESPDASAKAFMTAALLDGETARYPLQLVDEHPAHIRQPHAGLSVIDFGKATFGKLRLNLSSDKTTDTVLIRLGEHARDGRVDRTPGGSIRYAEYRLPLMKGAHSYNVKIRPDQRNTNRHVDNSAGAILMPDYIGEVLPFRYCEIENYDAPLHAVDITRQTARYPFDDGAGAFHSSDSVLNQVWELCKHSVMATSFLGIFVDGDRERIPYEGDIIIGQLTRYAVDLAYEFTRFSNEYLIEHPTWPTEWHLQLVLLAWADYLYSGNPASLQRHYDDYRAKTLSMLKDANGLISTRTGKVTPDFLKSVHREGANNFVDIVDWPGTERDDYVFTDYNTVVNAYHYEALRLMSEIAGAVGKTEEQSQLANEALRVKTQMNRLLLNTKTGSYTDGIGTAHSSLHANIYPLAFGITPDKYRAKALQFIRSRGMACSVYGAQALLDAVYNGHDAAYGLQLLASTDERSWYNMIRAGSTMSLEAWDDKYKSNQDWNHIWGAAAGNLISRKLMGIEPIEPGFRKIRIKPQPATLRQADIKAPSVRGDILVSFDNLPGEKFTLEIEIPANTTAEVWLPRQSEKYRLTVDEVSRKGTVNGDFVIVETGSGKHVFVMQ
ncbi:MAG: alpha-L-rhamnosidase [Tannerella sp.]|nr:alpha-L-rhamnosidase [Tannerella sp.]